MWDYVVGSYRASLPRHAHLRQLELAGEHGSPDTKKAGQAKRFSHYFDDLLSAASNWSASKVAILATHSSPILTTTPYQGSFMSLGTTGT